MKLVHITMSCVCICFSKNITMIRDNKKLWLGYDVILKRANSTNKAYILIIKLIFNYYIMLKKYN